MTVLVPTGKAGCWRKPVLEGVGLVQGLATCSSTHHCASAVHAQMGSGLPGPPAMGGGGLPQPGSYGPPGGWQPGQQQGGPPPLQQQQGRPGMMLGGPPPSQGMLPQHQQMPPHAMGGGPPPGLPYQGMPPAQQVNTPLHAPALPSASNYSLHPFWCPPLTLDCAPGVPLLC